MHPIRSWGKHSVHNIFRVNPFSIRSYENIYKFNKALVKGIDMKAYGEPQIVHFGEEDKKGYTLVQLIETSNIMAHFVEETNDIYLDVFSCKDFDAKVVENIVQHYFQPQHIHTTILIRQAKGVNKNDFPGVLQ
jgi:S-adenosylmethionine/arginine decarboxylase-like enzyme